MMMMIDGLKYISGKEKVARRRQMKKSGILFTTLSSFSHDLKL